jgi:hypothetical protein
MKSWSTMDFVIDLQQQAFNVAMVIVDSTTGLRCVLLSKLPDFYLPVWSRPRKDVVSG